MYILGQNWLIYLSIIDGVLCYYLITHLYRVRHNTKPLNKKTKPVYLRNNRLIFAGLASFSILLAITLDYLTGWYTDSALPTGFTLMCLPFSLGLGILLIALLIKKKYIYASLAVTLLGLVFSLVIVNDYYRYYPTLGDVFSEQHFQEFQQNNQVVTQSGQTNQVKLNKSSTEYSLNRLMKGSTAGRLYSINIPGTVSKFQARSGYVYVPAAYSVPGNLKLPVMVLLAGVPGTPSNWVDLGLQNIMNKFASSHSGVTPLVFIVDETGSTSNDTECVNSPRGNVETYLTVDVPNYIKQNFDVSSNPSHWAIGGLSLGGMCGIMLTLRHPDTYHYFIDLGGEAGPEVGDQQKTIDTLFHGSFTTWQEHQPGYLLAHRKFSGVGGFFGTGDSDTQNVEEATEDLSKQSRKAGLSTETVIVKGGHTFNIWSQTFTDALPWLSSQLGATSCKGSCLANN